MECSFESFDAARRAVLAGAAGLRVFTVDLTTGAEVLVDLATGKVAP